MPPAWRRFVKTAFVTAAILLATTGAAFAQSPAPDFIALLDANKDGEITRDEYSRLTTQRFGMADANRDGRLTGAERTNQHGQPGPEQNLEQYLAQSMGVFNGEDTNKDGKIAGDEIGRLRSHIAGGSQPLPARKP